jgi:hypothetical protein
MPHPAPSAPLCLAAVLAFGQTLVMQTFFIMFSGIALVGAYHALLVLPVCLSLLQPSSRPRLTRARWVAKASRRSSRGCRSGHERESPPRAPPFRFPVQQLPIYDGVPPSHVDQGDKMFAKLQELCNDGCGLTSDLPLARRTIRACQLLHQHLRHWERGWLFFPFARVLSTNAIAPFPKVDEHCTNLLNTQWGLGLVRNLKVILERPHH